MGLFVLGSEAGQPYVVQPRYAGPVFGGKTAFMTTEVDATAGPAADEPRPPRSRRTQRRLLVQALLAYFSFIVLLPLLSLLRLCLSAIISVDRPERPP